MVAAAIHHHTHQAVLARPLPPPLRTVPVNLLLLQAGPEMSAAQSQPGNKFTLPLITQIRQQINEMAGNWEAQ